MPDQRKLSKQNLMLETLLLAKLQIDIHSIFMICTYVDRYKQHMFCFHSVYTPQHTKYHIYPTFERNIRCYSVDHRDLQEYNTYRALSLYNLI